MGRFQGPQKNQIYHFKKLRGGLGRAPIILVPFFYLGRGAKKKKTQKNFFSKKLFSNFFFPQNFIFFQQGGLRGALKIGIFLKGKKKLNLKF